MDVSSKKKKFIVYAGLLRSWALGAARCPVHPLIHCC